jgi:hypothetical protein
LTTTLQQHKDILENLLVKGARSLMAAHAALPTQSGLKTEIADAIAAQERGYYKPDEDERLRESYVQYLGMRVSLWQTVQSLLPYIELPRQFKKGDWDNHLRAFSIAFCGAAMLVRSGYYLVDMANEYPVVREKLDEAEPRYGIERKQFTDIFNSLISAGRIAQYHGAYRFYEKNKDEIYQTLTGRYFGGVGTALKAEEPYFESRITDHLKRRAAFNVFSLRRRQKMAVHKTLFFLFESFGNDLSEMTQPLVKQAGAGKRISSDMREQLIALAQPGDVFVTRHDDAMTNLFLPGFWPHAALFIGTDRDREKIGVEPSRPAHQSQVGQVHFLEAKKDGVLFRPDIDTLAVDACVILRPRLEKKNLVQALNRALTHGGKLYDFVFDFSSADRLVCSELIYRAYDGTEDIRFDLNEKAGRKYLSTEDFLNQAISQNWFDVVALYGVGNDLFFEGDDAKKRLIDSYDAKMATDA